MPGSDGLFCLSGYQRKIGDKEFCNKAPQSHTHYERRLDGTEKCEYKHFDDSRYSNKYEIKNEDSECGPNTAPHTYCNQRRGDAQFSNYLFKLRGIFHEQLHCHTESFDT